tara:strand:- start:677 stop:910 length:234 start_codon:yes stop_codon:yes gene_type:complete
MTLTPESVQKQSLQWQEELKVQRDRLNQAQAVAADANQKIAMIEGGLQFASSLAPVETEAEVEGAVTIEEEVEQPSS